MYDHYVWFQVVSTSLNNLDIYHYKERESAQLQELEQKNNKINISLEIFDILE